MCRFETFNLFIWFLYGWCYVSRMARLPPMPFCLLPSPCRPSLPLVAAWTLLLWLSYGLAALICRLSVRRRKAGPYVLLYRNILGGYHPNIDTDGAWAELTSTVAAAAPEVAWARTPTFRLCYDDQMGRPQEICRSSIGFIVGGECGEREG